MSKYEDQVDSYNVICPYCKCEWQAESGDFSEDTRVEECPECGKKYHLHDSCTVDHYTRPDCELNGEVHKWETRQLTKGPHDFCSICDNCRIGTTGK